MATVLLIEDDADQCEYFARVIEDQGYQVVMAKDGWQGVKLAREVRPDVVVLDIVMPGMDGLEALSRMLADNRRLPCILHTSQIGPRDNFLSWSADAYVVKSPDSNELTRTIRALVS